MAKLLAIKHEFVEFVPEQLDPGILYISVQYKTMSHLCLCGCGKKVVTPISPTGWEFAYNGRSVSVSPSVGSWNLECKSHYVISGNRVQWAGRWSKEMIEAGYERDRRAKQEYYNAPPSREPPIQMPVTARPSKTGRGLMMRITDWWSRVTR
jgi:Family of unknown function (DUF6527)